MPTTDWKTPGAVSGISAGDSKSWSNLSAAGASDNDWVTGSSIGTLSNHDSLLMKGFGLTVRDIPEGASVLGVEVKVERHYVRDGALGSMEDRYVYLYKSDRLGSNQSAGATWARDTDASVTFGAADDLWGAALTDKVVRSPLFGVEVRPQWSGTYAGTPYVDMVQMRVTWEYPDLASPMIVGMNF